MMPRANRVFHSGYIWHLTQRCHKREFLLHAKHDRQRWRHWLFEAKKRYDFCVLNYIATSNHIHLLVKDRGQGEIASSMQLIAGRVAQEYNRRRNRRGAWWEDRYHATAVETGQHLARCMVYIDLNMVRAGVVTDPLEWDVCGYRELQNPPQRYRIIDIKALQALFGDMAQDRFRETHRLWVEEALKTAHHERDSQWTENLVVGSKAFVEGYQTRMGVRMRSRHLVQDQGDWFLRDPAATYSAFSG
jgi:putative transposase